VSVLLDAGAFIAIERRHPGVLATLKAELLARRVPVTHGGVVAQIWRGGSGRQAPISQLLAGVRVVPLDEALGRRTGMLLRAAKTSDVIDAALVALAQDGDEILTSDPKDLLPLATAAGTDVEIVPV
jgi:hypothetical protein